MNETYDVAIVLSQADYDLMMKSLENYFPMFDLAYHYHFSHLEDTSREGQLDRIKWFFKNAKKKVVHKDKDYIILNWKDIEWHFILPENKFVDWFFYENENMKYNYLVFGKNSSNCYCHKDISIIVDVA